MLKPYDSYKDTGVDLLKNVPNHWNLQRMSSIVEQKCIQNNLNEKLLSVYLNLGVVLYENTTKKQVHKPSEDMSKYQLVEQGDIVLNNQQAWRGSVGVSNYRGIVSPAYLIFKVNCKINSIYLNYLIRDSYIVDQFVLSSRGVGSIQRNIYIPYLKNVIFLFPPIKEQDQIAKYLDWQTSRINKLINAKKKQIELLTEQKQAIINKAVTKGLYDNVPMKDSGVEWLGSIPEHWEIRKLGSFATLQNGISESSEFFTSGFPFVSYGDVYNNYILPQKINGLAQSNKKQQELYSIKQGDILFTRTSETREDIARSSVVLSNVEKAVFSGFLIRARPTNNLIFKGFSVFYFRNELLRNYFVLKMNIVTRASLSQGILRNLPVTLPPIEEQQVIAEYLDNITIKIENAITKTQQQIDLLSEYKTSLISSVVTGKIDVRDVVIPQFDVVDVDGVFDDDEIEME